MAADRRTARGWYHGWTIVAVCILSGFAANALAVNCFSLFLGEWARDFHGTISGMTLGIVGMGAICCLVAPITGILVDRYSPRTILTAGLIALAILSIGMSYAQSRLAYLLLYICVGPFALSMATSIPANAMLVRWFVRHRGFALAATAVGLGLAGVVMPPIIAKLMPIVGWRQIWFALGVITVVLLIPLVLWTVRDRREEDGTYYLADEATAARHGDHAAQGAHSLRIRDILTSRTFWLLICAYIPMLTLAGGAGQNLAPLAMSRGQSAETAGLFLSCYSSAHVIALLVVGALSDRIGNRLPLAGLAFLCALGGVILAFADNPALLVIGAVALGCGNAFWPLLASAMAIEFGPAGIGRAFGLLTLFLPITGVGPYLVAKMKEVDGNYILVLLAMAVVATAGGIAALFLREKRPTKIDDLGSGTSPKPTLGPASA